jgi:uncharacterized protein YoxC
MSNWNTETLLTVLVAITGLSLLLQFAVLLGIFIVLRKGMKVAEEKSNEFTASLKPILSNSTQLLQKTNTIVENLEPKLSNAATDLTEILRTAREQTERLQASVEEINQRARRQAARVDGMTTSVLNGLDRAGHMVNEAVNIPVRQVSGIIAAAKAVVDTLRSPAPQRRRVHESPTSVDKDLFV